MVLCLNSKFAPIGLGVNCFKSPSQIQRGRIDSGLSIWAPSWGPLRKALELSRGGPICRSMYETVQYLAFEWRSCEERWNAYEDITLGAYILLKLHISCKWDKWQAIFPHFQNKEKLYTLPVEKRVCEILYLEASLERPKININNINRATKIWKF